jgi:hypothetical protein
LTSQEDLVSCPYNDDLFSIYTGPSDLLTVDTGEQASGGGDALLVSLLNQNGQPLISQTKGWTFLPGAGHYYIAVSPQVPAIIPYDLSIQTQQVVCEDDLWEPNNALYQSTGILVGATVQLRLCPYSPDFYFFHAEPGQQIVAEITFDASVADLALRLYDELGALIAESDSLTGTESVSVTMALMDTYVLEVNSPDDVETAYSLSIDVQ